MSVDELREHVMDFFGDKSRSAEETKEGLEEISDLIDTLVESL